MKKLDFNDIKEQQIVDVRMQYAYQTGHVKKSLNLIPENIKKYASFYLDLNEPILLILDSEEQVELDELAALVEKTGFTQVEGYLLANDIPADKLHTLETIPAKEFLRKEEDYILLDVRHPDEITRPAPKNNLVNIPFEELINDYSSLDKNKKIYTLCGSGGRSTAAASYLSNKGYKVEVIEGGMKAIQEIVQ